MQEGGETIVGDGRMHMHSAANNHRKGWLAILFAGQRTGKTWRTQTVVYSLEQA